MALNYVVSAQKATIVHDAVVGNFTGPKEMNLILAKTNRIELFSICAEGLKAMREIPVFGRIACIKKFRLPNENVDSLLILTTKYHLSIICCNSKGEVRARASGHIADRVGKPSETGIIACVHESALMAFRLYDGVIKIIQWTEGKELRGHNIRCEDLFIIDVQFLAFSDRPVLVYIYQDQNGRHIKATEIKFEDKELSAPLWKQDSIEAEASMLIPIPEPIGGVVVIGLESISYHKDEDDFHAIVPPLMHQSLINCYGMIDPTGERFLLGDMSGRIFMLMLILGNKDNDENKKVVKDIKMEMLGEASIPQCLVYIDNGVAFLGSRFGDSQLIRISEEADKDGHFITFLDHYTNLGPIRDMAVVTVDGQQQVVTCSGAYKDGSLRIIRNGIGIEELAFVELRGIKSLFSLNVESELDDHLVVGMMDETHILKIIGEELEDCTLPGFSVDEPTLWAGRLLNGGLVQITPTVVLAITGEQIQRWESPSRISVVSVNEKSGQAVIASGNRITLLDLRGQITVLTSMECEYEVACLDISPIGDKLVSDLCAVGFWTDMSYSLLSLPDLKEITRDKTGGDVLARSMIICEMEGTVYLLVALGDGILHYYQISMDTGALIEPKKATIGTQPTMLRKFISRGKESIFACSDRPTVIYSSNQKLAFSNVNLKLVAHMCPLNSVGYRDCLVLADSNSLVIGKVDAIQKLHIRSIPLGESPARIAHQPETNTFAVLVQRNEDVLSDGTHVFRACASTMAPNVSHTQPPSNAERSPAVNESSEEVEVSSVLLLDQNTFEFLHACQLGKDEMAQSIKSCKLGDDPDPYYVVGTAIVSNDETEAKLGRIMMFSVSPPGKGDRLRKVYEKEVKGAPYSIETISGGKLVVAINSCVRLFEWTSDKELRLECSDFDNVTALCLRARNELVLVGDLMRSLSLLSYKPMESSFEKIARDYVTNWISACEIIDTDTYLGAENGYNLFTDVRDTSAVTKEESVRLQELGLFYLGEPVNVFRHGSLVSSHNEGTPPYSTPILFGTSDGGLGVIVQLSPSLFK
ncbi:hypothetical protein AB6A40_003562 [Gnathostoma spinigerum]|uniref:DNA damage-binding protein 1 n=1 Tax=Gnathostoma spinigerum TaxID=75299 RepID=A0ABD6E9Y7_9BILA